MRIWLIFILLFGNLVSAQQTIKTISFEGLEKTKESSLKKYLLTKVNQPLDSITLEKDRQFLNRLPSIADVKFSVLDNEVLFIVDENFTIIPWLELYESPNNDPAIGLGIAEFNLLGRNIQLGGYYRYDVFNSFGIQTRAPLLFGRNYGLGLGYFNNKSLEPVFFPDSEAIYSYKNEAFEVSGIFQLHQNHQLETGFRIFSEDYQFLGGIIPENIPTELNTNKQNYFTKYIYDDLDYLYYKVYGFKNQLRLDYIHGDAIFNTEDFAIAVNDLRYYKKVKNKGNFASRLIVAIATNSGSPFAPFEIDNQKNTRGAGNVIDRGTTQIVLNNEYRHTLIEKADYINSNSILKKPWFVLQGNVFIDASTLQRATENSNALTNESNIRIYSGIGLRFIHKRIFNATFRIDYGFGLTKDSTGGLVFGIGQYF